MVRRGLCPSRETARRLIEANGVLVAGSFATKPARMVDAGQSIELVGPPPRFVGRGGEKLAGALDTFPVDPTGKHCLDIGSSTGGFTDCLLQAGAATVTAVDVGTNQLHERLRTDDRVTVKEQTDVRSLQPHWFERPFDLVVGDLSFISLRLVLPAVLPLVADGADLLLLVKPQFEAGRREASKGRGIISDPGIWRRVVHDVVAAAADLGAGMQGVMPSPIVGSAGNTEFVTWLRRSRSTMPGSDGAIEAAVRVAMERAGLSTEDEPTGEPDEPSDAEPGAPGPDARQRDRTADEPGRPAD